LNSEQQEKKLISIWGVTGSIGTQTMEVMAKFPMGFTVKVLTAHSNVELLYKFAVQWQAETVVLTKAAAEGNWKKIFEAEGIEFLSGRAGLLEAAARGQEDIVLNALVGSVGLEATMAALAAGSNIALANKEVLVMAGQLVMDRARQAGLAILPVDSEHSALFQCLQGENPDRVSKLVLTASGGPFRNFTVSEMQNVSISQALNHPNWSMGKKVTIDSATMVNKGLEVIEARWLFDQPGKNIEVVIHPQSIVHSLVEYQDGSVIAQLSNPDMKLPICYALAYPDRWPGAYGKLDFSQYHKLEFIPPDLEKFPGLKLAFACLETGGTAPAVLNAADEAAVDRFLSGEIGFMDIPRLIEKALMAHEVIQNADLETILQIDKEVRERTYKMKV